MLYFTYFKNGAKITSVLAMSFREKHVEGAVQATINIRNRYS